MTTPIHQRDSLLPLTEAAAAGRLRLDAETAGVCAQACDAMLDALDSAKYSSQRLSTISAYGTLGSAQQLGAKFESKATGAQGLRDVLQQHIDTVAQLRDLFEKAGRAYRNADEIAAGMVARRTGGG